MAEAPVMPVNDDPADEEYVKVPTEKANMLAEKSKAKGNEALKKQDFEQAVTSYSVAINLVPTNHVYYRHTYSPQYRRRALILLFFLQQ